MALNRTVIQRILWASIMNASVLKIILPRFHTHTFIEELINVKRTNAFNDITWIHRMADDNIGKIGNIYPAPLFRHTSNPWISRSQAKSVQKWVKTILSNKHQSVHF